jgi:cellobiose phosphorylase
LIPEELQFFNGIGGFSKNGKEYIIQTTPTKRTAAPWINVLGNPQFGTIVTESGMSLQLGRQCARYKAYTWNNDPVTIERRSILPSVTKKTEGSGPHLRFLRRQHRLCNKAWVWLQCF